MPVLACERHDRADGSRPPIETRLLCSGCALAVRTESAGVVAIVCARHVRRGEYVEPVLVGLAS